MREKSHRLPKEVYGGRVSVAFTLCIKDHSPVFRDPDVVKVFTLVLAETFQHGPYLVPVYCFMPDHQHIIVTGTEEKSDVLKSIVRYKQKTGYWLSKNIPETQWQKGFYDHIIRKHEDLSTQVRYILDNPVRKELVASWRDYPFTGSFGCKLDDVLNGII